MTITHECAATGCYTQVIRAMLMCRRHWFMVSPATRARVWGTYEPGQERPGVTAATGAYVDAMVAAIAEVAEREGRSHAAHR